MIRKITNIDVTTYLIRIYLKFSLILLKGIIIMNAIRQLNAFLDIYQVQNN